jgi:hypothetical protein
MSRKWLFIAALFGLIFGCSGIGSAEEFSLRVGETLVYKAMAKTIIHGADQTVKVVSKGNYRNREVYNIHLTMNTIGLVREITKYSEKEDLILDAEGMYPWYIRHEVTEGDSIEVEEVSFDYSRGVAVRIYYENNGPKIRTEIKLPGFVQDGVSLQYYLRKADLNPGVNQIYFYSNGKVEPVSFNLSEGNKPLKLECGTFDQYLLLNDPVSKFTVMIAKNQHRYPLVIQKIANFGKVEARLIQIY